MFSIGELQIDPTGYISKLEQQHKAHPNDFDVTLALTQSYFEIGNPEKAMPLIQAALEADPQGVQCGPMYLWVAQLSSGTQALLYYEKALKFLGDILDKHMLAKTAIENQRSELAATADEVSRGKARTAASTSKTVDDALEDLTTQQKTLTVEINALNRQMCQAKLGMIEVWMTELCMEPQAESECEKLINGAFLHTDNDPEAWSILGSIRISQMRHGDACTALLQSWNMFSLGIEEGEYDNSVIDKLLRLAQNMVETSMYEEVADLTELVFSMDDLIPEIYYLNALSHQLMLQHANSAIERSKHIQAVHDAAFMLHAIDEDEKNPDPIDAELLNAVDTIAASMPALEIENPYDVEDGIIPPVNPLPDNVFNAAAVMPLDDTPEHSEDDEEASEASKSRPRRSKRVRGSVKPRGRPRKVQPKGKPKSRKR